MDGGRSGGQDAGRKMNLVREAMLANGRVQGVGFRWYARGLARKLGLTGHVMNLPDGSVALEVQGLPEQLEAFAYHLAHPPLGWPIRVARLSRRRTEPVPGERDFGIARWGM